jgi:glycosyltransferase involved in cell wall biosynthesis
LQLRHKCRTGLAIGLSREYLDRAAALQRGRPGYRLLYVGRLLECKGVDLALHAIGRLKSTCPQIRFTIVGGGPAKPSLVELASELGISEAVTWISWLPQDAVEAHYRDSDLFLFPGMRDSGAMVVLEALAHGLPVVCTDLGGPGAIITPGCGRVLITKDRSRAQIVDAMAEAIHEILTVPGLYARLAAGTRARARQFEFQHLVNAIYPPAAPQEPSYP